MRITQRNGRCSPFALPWETRRTSSSDGAASFKTEAGCNESENNCQVDCGAHLCCRQEMPPRQERPIPPSKWVSSRSTGFGLGNGEGKGWKGQGSAYEEGHAKIRSLGHGP